MDKSITVLMSTYNGEKYLKEQIDSILAQKDVDLRVLIRDDGSSDGTLRILDEYASRDTRVRYYKGKNVGPAKSFLELMYQASGTTYYSLCDQDDVWDDDKLFTAITMIQKLDQAKPALYYSNLRLVDANMNYIRDCFLTSQHQSNKYASLLENKATGCTCVYNSAAAELFQKAIPDYCSMHDTWVYVVCKIMGQTIYDEIPHMSYRQHGNNVVGATVKKGFKWYSDRICRFFDRSYQPRYNNAICLENCYGSIMDNKDLEKLRVITQYKKSIRNRLKFMFDKDFKTSSNSRILRDRLLILFGII